MSAGNYYEIRPECMTPLEELQAAHKRLSELRGPNDGRPSRREWYITGERDGFVEIGNFYGDVVSAWGDHESLPASRQVGDLIVTLHRTIDWQLAYLKDHIRRGRRTFKAWGHGWVYVDSDALALARAINGEAS